MLGLDIMVTAPRKLIVTKLLKLGNEASRLFYSGVDELDIYAGNDLPANDRSKRKNFLAALSRRPDVLKRFMRNIPKGLDDDKKLDSKTAFDNLGYLYKEIKERIPVITNILKGYQRMLKLLTPIVANK